MKCIWHAGYCRNSRTGLQHQQNTKTVYYYCNDKCCFSPQHHFLLFHSITRSFLSFFRIFVIRSFLRFVKKFWSCIVCHCSFLQIFNHKLSGQFITHQDHVRAERGTKNFHYILFFLQPVHIRIHAQMHLAGTSLCQRFQTFSKIPSATNRLLLACQRMICPDSLRYIRICISNYT